MRLLEELVNLDRYQEGPPNERKVMADLKPNLMLDETAITTPISLGEVIKIIAGHTSKLELIFEAVEKLRDCKTNGDYFQVISLFRYNARLEAMNQLIDLMYKKGIVFDEQPGII